MTHFSKTLFTVAASVATGVVGVMMARAIAASLSPPPANIGVADGQLAPCPNTPNCVSTQANDNHHKIAPIAYTGEQKEAKAQLMRALFNMNRSRLMVDLPDYVYVEFRSPLFHFIDDTEFYFDDSAKLIHMRSAARLGQGDGGMNRRRLETIRLAFEMAG